MSIDEFLSPQADFQLGKSCVVAAVSVPKAAAGDVFWSHKVRPLSIVLDSICKKGVRTTTHILCAVTKIITILLFSIRGVAITLCRLHYISKHAEDHTTQSEFITLLF